MWYRQLAGAKAMAEGKSASAILVKNPAPPPVSRKGRAGKKGAFYQLLTGLQTFIKSLTFQ